MFQRGNPTKPKSFWQRHLKISLYMIYLVLSLVYFDPGHVFTRLSFPEGYFSPIGSLFGRVRFEGIDSVQPSKDSSLVAIGSVVSYEINSDTFIANVSSLDRTTRQR